ncbi:AMP-binding protein [Pseudonocardia sp. ICBG1293]|uniref:AMP-binding protein n=1 Tax=Pseudonocardia sp. ICBG1293 TaxID=2844382 RepID=UPI001CCD05F6|nr:AMP-binding protein [Pseudonocardia sp. ICBG1293]
MTARPTSVLEAFRRTAADTPGDPVLRCPGRDLSAAEVDRRSDAFAAALLADGLRPGDRVALYLQNDPQYVVTLLAVWKAGATAVAVNPMLTAREVRLILDDSGARVLVALAELHRIHGAAAVEGSTVTGVVTTDPFDDAPSSRPDGHVRSVPDGTRDLAAVLAAHDGEVPPPHAPRPDDVAVLTYTSGTTGTPKGACNTHANVLAGGLAYRDWYGIAAPGAVLGIAPLFHVTGLSGHIAAALVSGVPLVLAHRFDPAVVAEVVRATRPSFTVAAITALMALCRSDADPRGLFSSFTAVASGGAPIAPAVVAEFETATGLYVHNAYGMTETTSPTHAVPVGGRAPVDPRSGALSVGRPVPDCAARIDAPDESGVGELLVRGSRVVPGYWERPEETAATFTDGWLRTGDVGFVDGEGWFYVVDRKKDVIVASGYKVWPRDVEDVLLSHPAVVGAAVVGVPDERRGETVKAVVAFRPGTTDAPTPQELIAWARERMAAYKYPRIVEVVPEIPKTATGKILRRALREERTR